ncbi:hypothetical protein BDV38DRAFT_235446 [Aspergillus pseudotamarii]|uniref:Uncharacterized protein n=1 Tax=Aspergillus pseudotamarii TaxID=132259 RepID=A0A5N6T8R8_ASPPS|nr:uncharacterized protein BDV38DRAFT_235446 [Aspergillus pseudotamarii]KAE8142666.1 hypothetical protein BDV38DRAFT_235446 [Aspergillus pseudotamarii]
MISEINEPSTSCLPHSRQIRNFCCPHDNKFCSCIAKAVHRETKYRLHMFSIVLCQMASLHWRRDDHFRVLRWRKDTNRSELIPCLLRPALCLLNLPCLAAYAS